MVVVIRVCFFWPVSATAFLTGFKANSDDGPVRHHRWLGDDYFAEYPLLLRDPSYVEFLRTYAAASVSVPDGDDERWVAMLPGLIEDHWALVPFTTEG